MRMGKLMPSTIWNKDIAQKREKRLFTSRKCTVEVRYPSLTFESAIQMIKNHKPGIIQIPQETGHYAFTVSHYL